MEKNSQKNFTNVEIDTVTGEYVIRIPEWILNEQGWYEGTELNIEVDGDALIITEV